MKGNLLWHVFILEFTAILNSIMFLNCQLLLVGNRKTLNIFLKVASAAYDEGMMYLKDNDGHWRYVFNVKVVDYSWDLLPQTLFKHLMCSIFTILEINSWCFNI